MAETIVSLLGIVIIATVAIYTIRKTAKESRVSNIHAEMCACLVDTVSVLNEVFSLLNDITRHVVYNKILEDQIAETAYERYWRELGNLSKRFKEIYAKQQLVFPRKLYKTSQEIVQKVNDARKLARVAKPDKDAVYPDTSKLQQAIKTAFVAYRNFVNDSRAYLGTDKLEPIMMATETTLKAQENKQPLEPREI